MEKFFSIPFAVDGDREAVPNDAQEDNTVSYTDGYTESYSLPSYDPDTIKIERTKMNGLYYALTKEVGTLQKQGIPDFITSALNGGDPYPYADQAVVRYAGKIYISLEDDNESDPTDGSKWAPFTVARGRTVIASGAVTVINTDGIIGIAKTVPAATTVNVPDGLTPFKVFTIKDAGGDAGTHNITIVPASGTIDGRASFVMQSDYESVDFYSDGTDLRIV